MKLHFLGANRQVTGSCYCLETIQSRVMIDCGLFQEREYSARNWQSCPLPPDSVQALVLTHAHIDHCGLVPRLVNQGFAGPVICTPPTADLLKIMLEDAARIQVEDAAYKRKRHRREGRQSRYPDEPLYEPADVERTLPLAQPASYGRLHEVTPDIAVTFHDAGHILGSAMLEVQVREGGEVRRLIFSGDIGQWGKPLVRDPSVFTSGDYVVMESTYGDREHEDGGDVEAQLGAAIRETLAAGGKVVIPTFAVERAQELMYYLARLLHGDGIPPVNVYLDSPMAVDVTEVFRRHRDSLDRETWQLISSGRAPLHFPGLHLARTTDESKQINEVSGPAVIMATSGMCTAGRIKHHLKRHLRDPRSTILFVGYQAQGTLGRQILDGKAEVRIHGSMWPVRARVAQIYGFSGHADRQGLLDWLSHFSASPRRLFLTHGDEDAAQGLATEIRRRHRWGVSIPHYQSTYDLL
jgi:metallo-beta-lactamase family protein